MGIHTELRVEKSLRMESIFYITRCALCVVFAASTSFHGSFLRRIFHSKATYLALAFIYSLNSAISLVIFIMELGIWVSFHSNAFKMVDLHEREKHAKLKKTSLNYGDAFGTVSSKIDTRGTIF